MCIVLHNSLRGGSPHCTEGSKMLLDSPGPNPSAEGRSHLQGWDGCSGHHSAAFASTEQPSYLSVLGLMSIFSCRFWCQACTKAELCPSLPRLWISCSWNWKENFPNRGNPQHLHGHQQGNEIVCKSMDENRAWIPTSGKIPSSKDKN